MDTNESLLAHLQEIQKRFKKEMPRIRKEISVYEANLANGKLNLNPTVAPQFKK